MELLTHVRRRIAGPASRLRGSGRGGPRLRWRPGPAPRDDAAGRVPDLHRRRPLARRGGGVDQLDRRVPRRPDLDHRPADGRCLVARAGRALQPPDRAAQGRPQRPRPRLPVHLDVEAMVRGDGRSGQEGHGRPRRAHDGAAVQREGPLPALVRRRGLVLHRHHDERRDHLRSRPRDGRRGPPADRHRALPDHAPPPRAR